MNIRLATVGVTELNRLASALTVIHKYRALIAGAIADGTLHNMYAPGRPS
jgi:hypothetical protein